MRIGYLDCFAGISGDMLLGALVDAGVSRALLEEAAAALNIGATLQFSFVDRSGISATKVDVLDAASGKIAEQAHSHEHHHHDHDHKHDHAHGRSWKHIRELIERAPLAASTKRLALCAFELLAHAEAKIHNKPVQDIHFHEVGAVDTITDIVCAAAGLCSLGVDAWYASSVNTGSGFVQCAHGLFPVPAPATAELLKGIPTYSAGVQKELTTPTGAAMLKALDCTFGNAPAFAAELIGYGAGTRNPKDFPNVLRLSIGETVERKTESSERVTVLECAVDDAAPQLTAHVMDRALEEGALDVMCTPVVMKKGRIGSLLTVLCRPERRKDFESLLLLETTTLGLRMREEDRCILQRRFIEVETPFGRVRVKIGSRNGSDVNWMPEYEDCAAASRQHNIPLKQIMQAALAAISEKKANA